MPQRPAALAVNLRISRSFGFGRERAGAHHGGAIESPLASAPPATPHDPIEVDQAGEALVLEDSAAPAEEVLQP